MGRAANPWIALEHGVHRDRKTLVLANALSITPMQAVGHLSSLWVEAMAQQQSGDVTGVDDYILAEWAGWYGPQDSVEFASELRAAGWIKVDGSKTTLSGWTRLNGTHMARLEYKRAHYRRQQDVSSTEKGRQSDKHPTLPNPTKKKKTPPTPSRGVTPARMLVKEYTRATGKKSLPRTEKMLGTQITKSSESDELVQRMMASIVRYERVLKDRAQKEGVVESRYVIECHNFFGKEQKWLLYDDDVVEKRPRVGLVLDVSDIVTVAQNKRAEIWRRLEGQGMSYTDAKAESYRIWTNEGWPEKIAAAEEGSDANT